MFHVIKILSWKGEKQGERRERALHVSPGYSVGYEKISPAWSPMRALAPALPIPCVSGRLRREILSFPRQILSSPRQIASPAPKTLNPRRSGPNHPQITLKSPPAKLLHGRRRRIKEMGRQSKRTRAPEPLEVPPSVPHLVPPGATHLVPPGAPHVALPPIPQFIRPPPHPVPPSSFFPSAQGPGSWIPPPQIVESAAAQGPFWAPPASVGGAASSWCTPQSTEDSNLEAWGLDSHPPGGFLSILKTTPSRTQAVGNGTSSQPISVGDDTSGGDCERTEKRLLWTKEEDLRLVSAWLNNSNDPIQLHLNACTPDNHAGSAKSCSQWSKENRTCLYNALSSLQTHPPKPTFLYLSSSYSSPYSSPTMSESDDSDELAPSKIMEAYVAEQNVLDSFAERLMIKIKARLGGGLSQRRFSRRKRIRRDHEGAHHRLVEDYFAEQPLYPESMFRTRFHMNRNLFLRIVNALGQWSPYFTYRADCSGRVGLSPLQKCTAAMRMLAYGTPADALDEYLKIGKCTALECLDKFAQGVIQVFGGDYLRRPKREDVERLLQVNESRGFPGMLGSVDCMHWRWEKCPLAWRGQFTRGDYGVPTMVLEAVASQDLHIWHAFFGVAGSNNDLNVLNQSPLFFDALKGEAPQVQFSVNGNEYTTGYYLADGIYPEWAAFMKTIPLPQTDKHKLFAKHQEGARKDVERAFGVLQSRFTIVRRPARLWKRKSVGRIMLACVILHNMIVEDEKEQATIHIDLNEIPGASIALPPEVNVGGNLCFADVLRRKAAIRARPQHTQLKNDLIEHIWHRFRNRHHN